MRDQLFAVFAGTIHTMRRSAAISERDTLGEISGGTAPTIGSLYTLGRGYYDAGVARSGQRLTAAERQGRLKLAMHSCEQALTMAGTHAERLIRIDILLLMMDIVTRTKPVNTGERERYFYRAIEFARAYCKEDYLKDRVYGIRLREYYTTYINTKFDDIFNNKKWSKFITVMQTVINAESNKRISSRTKQASDTKNYISPKDTPEDILDKLEMAVGPVRLVIIAGANGEICTHHRIGKIEAMRLQEYSYGIRPIQTEVWHKERDYQYIIDRGSGEGTSQLDKDQLQQIAEPMIKIYIERLERTYFSAHADHGACIREHEEQGRRDTEPRDYSAFIQSVLSDTSLTGGRESRENYARAIDIARLVTSHHRNKTGHTAEDLTREIDTILGGKINRRVYTLVNSILLSRNETMHGTGYPFGLNQSKVSLEGKIYSIIRSYETLTGMDPQSPEKVISTLEEWGGGGYLDRELLSLFITTLSDVPTIPMRTKEAPTDRRIERHRSYSTHWQGLITHIDEMEGLYDEFRRTGASDETQKIYTQRIDRKRHEIHRYAGLENIIIIERHEQTQSDTQDGGAPGSPYEGLTDIGIANAIQKGKILKRLLIQIYRSPLPRARETTYLMCQQIRDCVGKCLGCPHIQSTESLNNTIKNREDGQSHGLMSKFISLGEGRQKALEQLALDMISSSNQSIHLIITHGDIIRHLLFMFENLFDPDQFTGVRYPVEQERVYTLLFRGDQIVEWDLLFSITDWELMVSRINEHTARIFGSDDIFSPRDDRQVSLIQLRDDLFDYIDNRIETYPERVGQLIDALDTDPLTAHFSQLLRNAGVIKNPQE